MRHSACSRDQLSKGGIHVINTRAHLELVGLARRYPEKTRYVSARPEIHALEGRCTPSYVIIELGPLIGQTTTGAAGVNNIGQAAGFSVGPFSGNARAVLWQNDRVKDLGTFGGPVSFAEDINEKGHIAGYATEPDFDERAFLYRDGKMWDLGTLPGDTDSRAEGLNDVGHVVGWSYTPGGAVKAFVYRRGRMMDPGIEGAAYAINNSGMFVGGAGAHAFVYHLGTLTDLGTLGGPSSVAYDINEKGQIAGVADISARPVPRAFLYSDGVMVDLGTLGGATSSAQGLNNHGDVVGFSETASPQIAPHAFLYSKSRMFDLNELLPPESGWSLHTALEINDAGWIVGQGINPAGEIRAFLLKPIGGRAFLDPTAFAVIHVSFVDECMRCDSFLPTDSSVLQNWMATGLDPDPVSSPPDVTPRRLAFAKSTRGIKLHSSETSQDVYLPLPLL